VAAVIFDLDGVLVDSEPAWAEARREIALEAGGRWPEGTQEAMMGMSSKEWSRYMRDELGVAMEPEEISAAVVERLSRIYRHSLPLLPGAREAVLALAGRWPLALASSANRPLIELVLELAGLDGAFAATVSSEEVPRGKPWPDVYLEAARRLDAPPTACAAIEDSANGIRAARSAGMRTIAIPDRHYPPDDRSLALADVVLDSIEELDSRVISGAS
jgi:HAD superfamily hydrolase (TIGR01509 family)